ncbi:hypothetical protein GQ44DRAFT_617014 [Phaeosphaeriaceae sp. PMI808]|nr:hypothetical protein GQ44DRAFT_617014 [Phaeosphaeriaceae sp. PMI808]
MDVNNSTALPMPTCMSQASVNPRKRKAPTLRDDDWEPFKGQITDLYTSGTPLKEVKELIEATSSFRAEIRQYKSRIKRWKLEKNIKSEEMKWIVKKRQRRRLVEAGKRDLRFLVRKNEVNSTKIDRWMRENEVPPDMLYSPKSLPCK